MEPRDPAASGDFRELDGNDSLIRWMMSLSPAERLQVLQGFVTSPPRFKDALEVFARHHVDPIVIRQGGCCDPMRPALQAQATTCSRHAAGPASVWCDANRRCAEAPRLLAREALCQKVDEAAHLRRKMSPARVDGRYR